MTISLLGAVQVHVGAQRIPLRGRGQRICIARLALAEGRAVATSTLIDDLWGDDPPRNAGHALQAQIHRLRTLLPLDIEFAGDGYRIDPAAATTDVQQFTALHDEGHSLFAADRPGEAVAAYDAALALWRGPALADIADVPTLHPYAVQLTGLRSRTASDRIEALLALGRNDTVIPDLRAAVTVDPLSETGWHQLIRALWQAGNEAEALTVFAQAGDALRDALGTEPGSRLTDLHRAILTGARPHTPTAGPSFIGRERERAVLRRARSRSLSGVQVVTLTGEPGIGKSTLAEAELDRAVADGARVLRGHCDPTVATPYQPITEMLRSALAESPELETEPGFLPLVPGLSRVLPSLAERFGLPDDADGADPRATMDVTLEAIMTGLTALAESAPLVLFIDDLHWADEQTLLTLRRLLRHPDRVPALIVLGMRDDPARTSETALTAEFLRQSDRVTHLPLNRFSYDESTQLIRAESTRFANASAAPDWIEDYVRSAAGGNPLFMVELTRQLLLDAPTNAPMDAQQAPPPPAGLASVIWGRIEPLPETTRAALHTAAVLGSTFPLDHVARLRGMTPSEAMAAIRPALDARLIDTRSTNRSTTRHTQRSTDERGVEQRSVDARNIAERNIAECVFRHDIVRTVLYDALPASERAALHTRVTELLESTGTGSDEARAHHFERSDLPDARRLAAEHLLRAGRAAATRGALADAEQLLSDAAALLDTAAFFDAAVRLDSDAPLDADPPPTHTLPRMDEPAEALRCDVLIALGSTQLRRARPDYRATLLEASRIALSRDDTARLIEAVLANNRGWWSSTAAVDHERVAHIEAALTRCPESGVSARAQLLAAWALENVRDPMSRGSVLDAADRALRLAERQGAEGAEGAAAVPSSAADRQALGVVLSHRYAVLYALFEAPEECVRLPERLMRLANEEGSPQLRLSAAVELAQASMRLGDFATADRHLDEAALLAEAQEDPARLWLVRGWQAMRTIERGRFAEGEALIGETFALGQQTGQADAATWFAGQLFTLRFHQGRLGEIVAEAREQVETVASGIPSWRAAMALALAHAGHEREAGAIIDAFAADGFTAIPRDILWLHGMHYVAFACGVLGRRDNAEVLYDLLLPHSGMVATNGTIGAGPVDVALGVLSALRGREDSAEEHFSAAAALSRRIDAPVWSAAVERLRNET